MKVEQSIEPQFELGHISPYTGAKFMLRGAFANQEKTKIYFGWLNVETNETKTIKIPIDFGRGHFTDKKTEAEMTKVYNDPSNIGNDTLAQYLNQVLLSGLMRK